jgi:hypothetical protein
MQCDEPQEKKVNSGMESEDRPVTMAERALVELAEVLELECVTDLSHRYIGRDRYARLRQPGVLIRHFPLIEFMIFADGSLLMIADEVLDRELAVDAPLLTGPDLLSDALAFGERVVAITDGALAGLGLGDEAEFLEAPSSPGEDASKLGRALDELLSTLKEEVFTSGDSRNWTEQDADDVREVAEACLGSDVRIKEQGSVRINAACSGNPPSVEMCDFFFDPTPGVHEAPARRLERVLNAATIFPSAVGTSWSENNGPRGRAPSYEEIPALIVLHSFEPVTAHDAMDAVGRLADALARKGIALDDVRALVAID